jgi:hypothetical protein
MALRFAVLPPLLTYLVTLRPCGLSGRKMLNHRAFLGWRVCGAAAGTRARTRIALVPPLRPKRGRNDRFQDAHPYRTNLATALRDDAVAALRACHDGPVSVGTARRSTAGFRCLMRSIAVQFNSLILRKRDDSFVQVRAPREERSCGLFSRVFTSYSRIPACS